METPSGRMNGHAPVPRGWLALFFGLAAWGIWYVSAHTPEWGGWSQYDAFREEQAASAGRSAAPASMHENPYEDDPKAVREGRGIYDEHCAGCHGKDLGGEPGGGPPLDGHLAFGETDGKIHESIASGRPNGMPPFGDALGRDRIRKLVAWIDSVREEPGGGQSFRGLSGEQPATLTIAPRPVRAMRDLRFTLDLPGYEGEGPLRMRLEMPGMRMGGNVVTLRRDRGGRWRGNGLLVRCASGGRSWTATVDLPGRGKAVVPFDAAP